MRRALVIVLDSLGIGALPDADQFGDAGGNTLAHVLDRSPVQLPNLQMLGLGNLLSHARLPSLPKLRTIVAKLVTSSPGKDTLTGHWEMMGYPQSTPFPTYPDGFPQAVIAAITAISSRTILGNIAASGTELIERFGEAALSQGALIVYTSADSVLQIAAHERAVPLAELYRICEATHAYLLESPYRVARVIARPFQGDPGGFKRTADRRDYAVAPAHTLLDTIVESGGKVLAVGKISDIFAGQGISSAVHTKSNREGIMATIDLLKHGQGSLIFTNLVDFDMLYGHRRDVCGYGQALAEFDRLLPEVLAALLPDDMLIITADHGCDPAASGSDHSREYVPCLVYCPQLAAGRLVGPQPSLCAVAATVADWLGVAIPSCGVSLLGGIANAGC